MSDIEEFTKRPARSATHRHRTRFAPLEVAKLTRCDVIGPRIHRRMEAAGRRSTLDAGDRVSVALTCYENHSWEIQGVFCVDHAVDAVIDAMAIRAEKQAVVSAVLEPTGYHPPRGAFQPGALTLGDVEIVDVSSTGAGYDP